MFDRLASYFLVFESRIFIAIAVVDYNIFDRKKVDGKYIRIYVCMYIDREMSALNYAGFNCALDGARWRERERERERERDEDGAVSLVLNVTRI